MLLLSFYFQLRYHRTSSFTGSKQLFHSDVIVTENIIGVMVFSIREQKFNLSKESIVLIVLYKFHDPPVLFWMVLILNPDSSAKFQHCYCLAVI